MDINYDDYNEKLEYFCHQCHRGIKRKFIGYFCPFCGHKFDFTKVNKLRQKIKELCLEEE